MGLLRCRGQLQKAEDRFHVPIGILNKFFIPNHKAVFEMDAVDLE